jgi:hypothetical protein
VRQSSGSRRMSLAPIPECMKPILWFVASLVPPPRAKYSPPESDVGIQISGTVGSLTSLGGSSLSKEYLPSSSAEPMSFASAY